MDAGLIFPSVGLDLYENVPDSDLLTEVFRIYNDWLAEFCQAFPDRLKGIAMINIDLFVKTPRQPGARWG